MAHAVIMAGGQGERFWPMTHGKFPKYRIRFDGKRSLLQDTYRRLAKVYPKNNIHVVTTKEHFSMIREELPSMKKQNILIEPFRNNTAAAIYLSCASIAAKAGEQDVISFFPADHLIQNEALFKKTVAGTILLAKRENCLVTVGIQPTFPAIGYGYIEAGNPVRGIPAAHRVKRFVEKPNRKKAEAYLRRKAFLWNGGIFTWRMGVFIDTMKKFTPDFYFNFDLKDLAGSYKKLPNLSIDYALMEKADNICVFKTRMDWCDMGNWDMMHEKSPKDRERNFSTGRVAGKENSHSLFLNHTERPLITLGLKNVIVVQTPRGTLVCERGRAEEAALIAKKLK